MTKMSKLIGGSAVAAAMLFATAASALDIGFVVADSEITKPFDTAWADRLVSQGYTVTPFADETPADDPGLASMNLFIVSSHVNSGDFLSGVGIDQLVSTITYEPALYDDVFGADSNPNRSPANTLPLTIEEHTHFLAQAMNGDVALTTGDGTVPTAVGALAPGTTVIGTTLYEGSPEASLMTLEVGALGGKEGAERTFPALWIGVPVDDDWDPTTVTDAGWKILDAAVEYALVPEPSSFALIGLGLAAFFARRRR